MQNSLKFPFQNFQKTRIRNIFKLIEGNYQKTIANNTPNLESLNTFLQECLLITSSEHHTRHPTQ